MAATGGLAHVGTALRLGMHCLQCFSAVESLAVSTETGDLLPAEQSWGRVHKTRQVGTPRHVSDDPRHAVTTYVYRVGEAGGAGKLAGASIEVAQVAPEP